MRKVFLLCSVVVLNGCVFGSENVFPSLTINMGAINKVTKYDPTPSITRESERNLQVPAVKKCDPIGNLKSNKRPCLDCRAASEKTTWGK